MTLQWRVLWNSETFTCDYVDHWRNVVVGYGVKVRFKCHEPLQCITSQPFILFKLHDPIWGDWPCGGALRNQMLYQLLLEQPMLEPLGSEPDFTPRLSYGYLGVLLWSGWEAR
jgi:hypothetical protein